jgi:hypothetical protein
MALILPYPPPVDMYYPPPTMRALYLSEYPEWVRGFSEVKGIYVNGCVSDGAWEDVTPHKDQLPGEQALAHAHNSTWDDYSGWICLNNEYDRHNKYLLLHELAHILTPGCDHNNRWRRKLVELGGNFGVEAERFRKWDEEKPEPSFFRRALSIITGGRISMSKQDAEVVLEHLKKANEAAVPLKDKTLTIKIKEASEHIEKKISGPQQN